MGYLDYAGLQYLWGKLKEKFAPKSHSHDDRYYTESEMDGKLNSKSNTNHTHDASTLINALGAGTAAPTDPDYIITQWVGGGTSNTTWIRRPMSSIWNYIKGKADGTYQPKGNYAASGHTHDDRYYTESEMNAKLSKKAENIVLASDTNLNNITTPGFYSCGGGNKITNKPNNIDAIGLIVTHNASGNYYTQILTTSSNANTYRRTCLNGSWSGWTQDKYTDTNTWRGIQNNLTSDSTSDSLSAAQGKVLKGLVDGKAPNGHTHSFASITDKPSTYTPSAHNQSWSTITDKPALMESGDYSAETIEALLKRVQGVSPRMGSCCLTKDTHVANTWWNFIYTPHRTGSGGDNPEYGTLLLFPMVGAGSSCIVRAGKDGVVKEIRKIYTSGDKPTKGDVGLGNVDNTADANKSVKYATSAGSASTATKATTAGTADKANSVDWSKVQNKPSSYPPASHSHAYLPLGGGTMTGNITFSDIGNTNTSNKISWNGSTDGADIYYQTTAGDQGNLVLNLRDDSNCYLRIAKNGTFKSYFSPDDGNFHGNVNGNVIGNVSGSSGSCTGNAATATKATSANKLTTARTVSGGTDIRLNFNYDGSGNSSASIGYYSCTGTVGNTNNYPWHRFASYGPFSGAWNDAATLFYIAQDYNGGGFGIFRICLRTNANSGSMSCEVRWLVRSGISADQVQIHYCPNESSAYADAFFKTQGTYAGFTMRAIASGSRAGIGSTWKLISSIESNGTTTSNKGSSSECWASIASAGTALHNKAYTGSTVGYDNGGVSSASLATTAAKLGRNGNTGAPMTFNWNGQGGQPTWLWGSNDGSNIYVWNPSNFSVNYAKSAGSVAWGNVSGKPSSYPPASHSHAYLPLGGGTMGGQITKSTGGSWIGDRDRAAIKSNYAGDSSYGAVAAMATKNGYWTMGNLGGNESLIFNYSTDANYNASKNETYQVYLPAQAGTIITSATIGNQTVNRAEYLANDSAYMRMHWSGQSGQPSWLWGGNDASNMYVYNPSNFSVNYAATAGNGVYSSNVNTWGDEGYIRFNDGIQICWGTSTSGSSSGSFAFPQRFLYLSCIMISGTGAYRYAFYVTKSESTGFSYYRDGSGSTVSPQYVAFGRWK